MNYNAFGISALKHLSSASKTQNVFISPLSIGVALAMAAEGAKGATREAMLATLGMNGADLQNANEALIREIAQNTDATAGIANALWTRQDVKPRPAYAELLRKAYGARAQALHFGNPAAAQTINAWTKEHTLGLIDKIVDRTTPQDFLYLTNALAFKGTWTAKFKKSGTSPAPFTDADGRKHDVQMMSRNGEYEIFEADGFSAIRMPYGKGGYAAYVLLPAGNDPQPLLKELSAPLLDRVARDAKGTYLHLELPRFTARYDAPLIPLLKTLGMGIAFTGQADFSGIHAIPPRLAITSVNHAAYVQVDEEGTTAAAATSVSIGITAIQRPQKQFIVNHPFVFALRDERTGTLLFVGVFRTLEG